MKKIIFDWHCHHDALLEPRMGTRKKRVNFIVQHKRSSERPLRLRLYKRVRGKLPVKVIRVGNTLVKTYDACIEGLSWGAYNKAWNTYHETLAECMPQIEKLHAKECPNCPWDGKTIFPDRR